MLLVVSLAHADEAVGSLRMRANDMVVPVVAAEAEVRARPEGDSLVDVGLAVDLRGVPGHLPGVSWGDVGGRLGLDALAPETPVDFDAHLSVWRRVGQSQPVVAAQDLRLGTVELGRDRALGDDLAVVARAVDWSAGLYLPSHRPGDIEARAVIGARALGVHWARPLDGRPDFGGVELGGISGEFVYGTRLGAPLTLTAHLGGRADWAIGRAEGFAARTDTDVWVGGVLEIGEHQALRLMIATRTVKDSDGWLRYDPSLTTAWRVTW